MLEDNKKMVKVTNRSNGGVGYTIPDLNLTRKFASGETKEVTAEEMEKLSYIPGGKSLIEDYLFIEDTEIVEDILDHVEPEYSYTKEDVKELLLNGSLDALKDCLDFGPAGVIDLVKNLAVELKLNDVNKRKAILDATGFNVDTAISIEEATSEENIEDTKIRRLDEKELNNEKTAVRRTSGVTYTKVTK